MQVLESIKDFSRHKFFLRLHFGHKWFTHIGCANGFSRLCHAFFGQGFILGCGTYQWSSFPGKHLSCFGHFVLKCSSSMFLFHMGSTSFFLRIFLASFDTRVMQVCGDIVGLGVWEYFLGPLVRCQAQLSISSDGISLFSMEDYAPFAFLGSWVLMALYLCSRFHIFNKPVLEEYVFKVNGGPHLFQSCLCVAWDDLPL